MTTNQTERVLLYGTSEFWKMRTTAELLNTFTTKNVEYTVEDTWLDYGAKWAWTTIIENNNEEDAIFPTCQILTPRQWKQIVSAETPSELATIAEEIIKTH